MVFSQGNRYSKLRPAPPGRIDRQLSAERVQTLAYPDQAQAPVAFAVERRGDVEAAAVVLDRASDLIRQDGETDVDPVRHGVLRGVPDGLLDDPVQGHLDRGRQARRLRTLDGDRNAGSRADTLDHELQGRDETEIVQDRRAELVRQPPEVPFDFIQRSAGAHQAIARAG